MGCIYSPTKIAYLFWNLPRLVNGNDVITEHSLKSVIHQLRRSFIPRNMWICQIRSLALLSLSLPCAKSIFYDYVNIRNEFAIDCNVSEKGKLRVIGKSSKVPNCIWAKKRVFVCAQWELHKQTRESNCCPKEESFQ